MAGIGQLFSMSAEQLAKGEQTTCTLYGNLPTGRRRMFGTDHRPL